MYVDYAEEHLLYKEAVDRFVEKRVRPLGTEFDFDGALSHEQVDDLLTRLRGDILDEVPRTEDGDIDWIAVGILLEGLASVSGSLAFLAIESLSFPASLLPLLDEAQKAHYHKLFQGGSSIASAFSEPAAGSNPREITTTARRDGDRWIISGTKLWSSGASHAAGVFVSCKVQDGDQAPAIGMFLVDRAESPYQTSDIHMLGLRSHSLAEVVFDDVSVPVFARVGESVDGTRTLNTMLLRARATMAVIAVGIAQRALDLAIEHAKIRTQFGKPIAGFQLIQKLLTEMATDVALGRMSAYRAMTVLQKGAPAALESSMAKLFCTEMAHRVASKGVQIHGAIGLSDEAEIQRLFRDARMLTIPDGTSEIQTLVIGRELTGISALS